MYYRLTIFEFVQPENNLKGKCGRIRTSEHLNHPDIHSGHIIRDCLI